MPAPGTGRGPEPRLKLLNSWTGQKEIIPGREAVRLFTALPPALQPGEQPEPDPANFPDLAALRVYCVADMLRLILARSDRRVRLVGQPTAADLCVASSPLAPVPGSLLVAVTAPVVSGQPGPCTLAEARYLLASMPPAGPLQWSEGALAGTRAALGRLEEYLQRLQNRAGEALSPVASPDGKGWQTRFYEMLLDDLNTPRALAVLWMMLQSDLAEAEKFSLLVEFGRVLGFGAALRLPELPRNPAPPALADRPARAKTHPLVGYEGPRRPLAPPSPPARSGAAPARPKPAARPAAQGGKNAPPPENQVRRRIIQSRDVRSHLKEAARFDFTVSLVAFNNRADLQTTLQSLLHFVTRSPHSVEVIVTEMNSTDGSAGYLEELAATYANFRVVYARDNLGEAAGRNVAYRQGQGRYMLLLDAGLKITADLFSELDKMLPPEAPPALYGLYPVELERSAAGPPSGYRPVRSITGPLAEVEALDGTVLCFRRTLVEEVGFMDEHFRVPYALGLDYSFAFNQNGYRVLALPGLERFIEVPAGFARPVYGLSPEQQERQRHKNWQNFLNSWNIT